jgi:uncharacterized hydrophobic protein (TIGR00271 family)
MVYAIIEPEAAEPALALVSEHGVADHGYLLARADVIAPPSRHGPAGLAAGLVWLDVLAQARANSRLIARFTVLMAVAGVIAALGVLDDNGILIVGAMAVSPDLLPVCAACVAIVGRRPAIARRAIVTLVVGLLTASVVAAALTWMLDVSGILPDDLVLGEGGIGALAKVDYSTALVALAAGVAAIISFETRASAAVGVAISVTTIPASAYFGVAIGLGEMHKGWSALLVLAINVTMIMLAGSTTLAIQARLAQR